MSLTRLSVDTPDILDTLPYEKQLETWNRPKPAIDSVFTYCQLLTQERSSKRLIELLSRRDVQALQLSLQDYCQRTSRPFFYIHSPDDLVCSTSFLNYEGLRGIITPGPGGPLHDFLQRHEEPVLIVNYDNFDADDLIRFNGLLDNRAHADDTALPPATIILGLINRYKPDCYQGADFYSRFDKDKVGPCPIESHELQQHEEKIASLPLIAAGDEQGEPKLSEVIHLYHAPDWQERLLGRWMIKQDGLYFVEGELEQALSSGSALELHNAPWEDETFRLFWQQAKVRELINYAGRSLVIPKSLQLIQKEGYAWPALKAPACSGKEVL